MKNIFETDLFELFNQWENIYHYTRLLNAWEEVKGLSAISA